MNRKDKQVIQFNKRRHNMGRMTFDAKNSDLIVRIIVPKITEGIHRVLQQPMISSCWWFDREDASAFLWLTTFKSPLNRVAIMFNAAQYGKQELLDILGTKPRDIVWQILGKHDKKLAVKRLKLSNDDVCRLTQMIVGQLTTNFSENDYNEKMCRTLRTRSDELWRQAETLL